MVVVVWDYEMITVTVKFNWIASIEIRPCQLSLLCYVIRSWQGNCAPKSFLSTFIFDFSSKNKTSDSESFNNKNIFKSILLDCWVMGDCPCWRLSCALRSIAVLLSVSSRQLMRLTERPGTSQTSHHNTPHTSPSTSSSQYKPELLLSSSLNSW